MDCAHRIRWNNERVHERVHERTHPYGARRMCLVYVHAFPSTQMVQWTIEMNGFRARNKVEQRGWALQLVSVNGLRYGMCVNCAAVHEPTHPNGAV